MTHIFVAHKSDNVSGKLTFTNIMETIPRSALKTPLDNWTYKYNTEWRWRFIKFFDKESNDEKNIVEISKLNNHNERIFINKYGEWVIRVIDPIFDQYVYDCYYYYTYE